MRSVRNFMFGSALVAGLMLCGVAQAAEVPAAKIGVVDIQTVATQSEPALAAKKQMEDKYGKERSNLETQGKKLQKKAEELKNPKASKEKREDFIKSKRDLDQKTAAFVRKAEQDEIKLRQDMVTLVFKAAYEVAKAKGFTFVVDVTAGGVLYADQSMDLTQDVLAEVNKLFKAEKDGKKDDSKSENK